MVFRHAQFSQRSSPLWMLIDSLSHHFLPYGRYSAGMRPQDPEIQLDDDEMAGLVSPMRLIISLPAWGYSRRSQTTFFFILAPPDCILDIDSSFISFNTTFLQLVLVIYSCFFIFSSTMSKLKWMQDKATVAHDPELTNAELMLTNDDLRPGENHYGS